MYLILDTNTWIFLANGYDTKKKSYLREEHFNLLDEFIQFTSQPDIYVLINDIIIDEWNRNEKSIRKIITEEENEISDLNKKLQNEIKNIYKKTGLKNQNKNTKEIKNKINNTINFIERSEKHIQKINEIIYTKTVRAEISDANLIECSKRGLKKIAPFHNSKNNIADCLILLSSIDFVKKKRQDNQYVELPAAYFISFNKNEFSSPSNEELIHEDLIDLFNSANISYNTNLGIAISSSKETIDYIEKETYLKYIGCQFVANEELHTYHIVELNNTLFVQRRTSSYLNPNQLFIIFNGEDAITDSEKRNRYYNNFLHLEAGNCQFCNSLHFVCTCGEEVSIYDTNDFNHSCDCGFKFRMLNEKAVEY